MLYLVGAGMEPGDLTLKALKALSEADVIFVEGYTSKPYTDINIPNKTIEILNREAVESDFLLDLAEKKDVVLLVPGDPLFATTHISLVVECKKRNIPCKIIHGISVVNFLAETGLSPYKFGRIVTLSGSESDLEKIKQNLAAGFHTLCLVDPAMDFKEALNQLRKVLPQEKKIFLCLNLGKEDQRIIFFDINAEPQEKPSQRDIFCFVIPGTLAFYEEEAINALFS